MAKTTTDDDLLGLTIVATMLGKSESTTTRYEQTGKLKCRRDSANRRLFKRADVERFKKKLDAIGGDFRKKKSAPK